MQPVAIVGVALRFPGAPDPYSFHDLTLSRRRRLRLDHPAGARWPNADGITPCHALAAQTAAAALADAAGGQGGQAPGWAQHGRAGAIVANCPSLATLVPPSPLPPIGAWLGERLGLADVMPVEGEATSGQPVLSAVSCSLHAVAAACDSLSSGTYDLMLAGGVSTAAGAGVPSGEPAPRDIRVYDENPTGTTVGEGCGMVVLMRADDAREAGLPVYAEIAGWGGPSEGPGLRALIAAAYDRAGIDPADLQLIEGHGAASADDDLAELSALLDVLGPGGHCALGSVSANIGDARGAAGVAALLKASLAMTAATIPPATGCVDPHELLRGGSTSFRLPRRPEEWPADVPQLAAVNSLGASSASGMSRSGATHLVLRREPDGHRPGRRRRARAQRRAGSARSQVRPYPARHALADSCPRREAAPLPPRPRPAAPPELNAEPEAGSHFPRAIPAFAPVGPAPRPARLAAPPQSLAPTVPETVQPPPAASPVPAARPVTRPADPAAPTVPELTVPELTQPAPAKPSPGERAGHLTGRDATTASQHPVVSPLPLRPGPAGLLPAAPAAPPAQAGSAAGALAPYMRMRRVIGRQSALVLGLLQAAPAADGAALPARGEPVPATGGQPAGGQPAVSRATVVAGRPGGARAIITVGGRDREQLIVRLDEIAARAAVLPPSRLGELAREAGTDTERAGEAPPGARAALLGTDTIEIAAMASNAAAILRVSGPAPIRAWPQLDQARQAHCGQGPGAAYPGTVPPEAAGPGVYLSEGARGRVALLFGGLAWTEREHGAELSAALAVISALRRLGVEASVAAGAGLGEIAGLAWADAITQEEAARLAARRAEILRPMGGLASMARVYADRETTARLVAGSPLVRAVDEGPRQQVIAGPLPSVRMLPRRGAELGVTAELLGAAGGLHSPAMRPCVPPMAAVAAGARIGALRRRLISSVTGVDFSLSGDPADLLSRQLERPALLASALARASADADLVVVTTPDPALARAAAACCAIPVIAFPSGADAQPAPELLAALYTAGAVPVAGRWAPGPPSARWRRAPAEPPTTPLVPVPGPRFPARR